MFGFTLVWSHTMLATGPCPLLRWAHANLSAGPPYLWSYISLELHSPAGALPFPRRGGARPMVQQNTAEEIAPENPSSKLYFICNSVFKPLRLYAVVQFCCYAFMPLAIQALCDSLHRLEAHTHHCHSGSPS